VREEENEEKERQRRDSRGVARARTGARATGGPGSVSPELEDQSGRRIPVSLVAEGAETASS